MELSAAEQAALDAARARDAALLADRTRRKREGIVHTPPELARFCARAVDDALVQLLGVADGLADASVHVIDPACGPGAFLAAALQVASARGRVGSAFTGLDRDAAVLDTARDMLDHARPARVSLRHVDTLREESLPAALAAEAPTLVVLGNPPWAASAAVSTPSMQRMLAGFHVEADGTPLKERKLGVLSDLYVRFFRWSLEVAQLAKRGAVIALVTNGSFLDGPVHRGMRAYLLREVDLLQVIDLGGNALVGRARGAGQRDENVFGVRPSVAITLLVRRPFARTATPCSVSYVRMQGRVAHKLDTLAAASVADLPLSTLTPVAPHLRFVPAPGTDAAYATFPSLAACMPFHREGVQSNRDAVVVAKERGELLARLREFAAGKSASVADAPLPHYDPRRARQNVARALELDPEGTGEVSARRLAYRPFDDRWFCPVTPLCHRPRPDLLAAFDHAPLALVSVRKDRGTAPYTHFGASLHPIDNCFVSTRSSCRARAFPVRTPRGEDNLADDVRDALSTLAGAPIDASAFVRHALCVLASPQYRSRFEHELRIDYPRIPLPTCREQLDACLAAGGALLELLTRHQRPAAATAAVASASEIAEAIAGCERAVEPLLAVR